MSTHDQKSIILFDGICNLCSASVQFILKRDHKKRYVFASLQSDAAKNILLQYNRKNNRMDSIVLVEDGKIYEKSTAALRICKNLSRPWPVFYLAIHLPGSWRDKIYELVAKNRYSWFGKKEQCMLMVPEYKNRFI